MANGAPRGAAGRVPRSEVVAPRGQLTRQTVVRAAMALVDESGAPGLTMRRLAGRLGVEAMSLYAHVEGKERLLSAIVDQLLDELLVGEDPAWTGSGRGWQESLRRLGGGFRDLALDHPRAFHLLAYRPAATAWLRPPLRTEVWAERFLDRLVSQGFSDQDAVCAYRAFSAFLLGSLLPEASSAERATTPDPGGDGAGPAVDASLPTVSRLEATLRQQPFAEDFAEGLTRLLDRFEASVSRRE